jgi:hypothetical protein
MTLGSYYSGPTRISLLDTSAKRVINTISLRSSYDEDSFDVPYRILPDYYYAVPGCKHGQEGKPKLLALRDFNGDGLPLEIGFFEAEACGAVMTALIGYSPRQDRVIQYQVELRTTTQKEIKGRGFVIVGAATTETMSWADALFAQKPSSPGHWSYKIDYTGRAGTIDEYRVHYDTAREKFFGDLTRTEPEWESLTDDQDQPKPKPAR